MDSIIRGVSALVELEKMTGVDFLWKTEKSGGRTASSSARAKKISRRL